MTGDLGPTSIIAQIGILQKITELQKKMQRNYYKGKKYG